MTGRQRRLFELDECAIKRLKRAWAEDEETTIAQLAERYHVSADKIRDVVALPETTTRGEGGADDYPSLPGDAVVDGWGAGLAGLLPCDKAGSSSPAYEQDPNARHNGH